MSSQRDACRRKADEAKPFFCYERKELMALAAGLPTICTSLLEASLAKVHFPRWPSV
jgi:hypothetical protein